MSYRVRTQAFTGPFDLLLTLVSRQKVDIAAVPVSEVADQFLDELGRMGEMDLDVTSDFILVASTLLDIKAASLVSDQGPLAAEPDEDDALDGLSADEALDVLAARLVAYKQFRNVGSWLAARGEAEARMHPRTAGPDPEFLGLMPDFLRGITLRSLGVICADLDGRRQELLLEAEHVAPRRLPVRLAVESVERSVRSGAASTFSELVGAQRTPEGVVVTLLALLELFKRGVVELRQEENFGEIGVTYVGEAGRDAAATPAGGDGDEEEG